VSATGLPLGIGIGQPISRRALLQAGGVFAGALALGAGGALLTGAAPDALAGLRRSDYTPWVGSTFHLGAPGRRPVPVRLEAVENPLRRPPLDPEAEFLLVFRLSPSNAPLGQDVMDILHPSVYTRSLLVTPISRRGLALGANVNRSMPVRRLHG
jgi:hypothetical protein